MISGTALNIRLMKSGNCGTNPMISSIYASTEVVLDSTSTYSGKCWGKLVLELSCGFGVNCFHLDESVSGSYVSSSRRSCDLFHPKTSTFSIRSLI